MAVGLLAAWVAGLHAAEAPNAKLLGTWTHHSGAYRVKLEIKPEAHPEQGHYYRSDHFSFARAGIPAFSISLGTQFYGKPADYGDRVFYRRVHGLAAVERVVPNHPVVLPICRHPCHDRVSVEDIRIDVLRCHSLPG